MLYKLVYITSRIIIKEYLQKSMWLRQVEVALWCLLQHHQALLVSVLVLTWSNFTMVVTSAQCSCLLLKHRWRVWGRHWYTQVPMTQSEHSSFPFSLTENAARWFIGLLFNSIRTWNKMYIVFFNKYFPLAKALRIRSKINSFFQRDDESLFEA